ncbi:4269_t:CDS:2 [Dentiscutata erythropus]|uniref:4269_t:CDS:1 n=1 Tax=Dentiscutata erythropus TaxID=1348616 RepID=A0A9N8ZJJ2_9GLOM|nr:4269_t:CDS:2 [Dentiscutata erythropus]
MVRCPKLFKWLTKASDVAIGRRKRQGENDFGTLGRNYKMEEPIIINKEVTTVSTGEDDGLELKEFHRMNKKKYRSLPVPALRKSQVMDENQKIFVVDKRRFAMVDPFIPSHNRSHTIDSTRTLTSFFGFDDQSQTQSDKSINNKDFAMIDNNSKVKLDFIDESNEESPATILVAKKEILTRHGQFSVHSARLIRGGSIQGYSHVIRKDDKSDLGKNATHFSVTQVNLQTKNVLRFSSLITESNTMDYFNEIKPMIFYLNYLDQISIIDPKDSINIKDVTRLDPGPGTCQCGKKIACVGYSAYWCKTCESRRFEKKNHIEIVNQQQLNQKEKNQQDIININKYYKSDNLQIMSFTRTHNPKEHFSVCEYIAAETALYSLKFATIRADNTEVAAEVYDILQYW